MLKIVKSHFPKAEIFHITNKSISNFGIFKNLQNGQRFLHTLYYYNNKYIETSFSKFLEKQKFDYKNIIIPQQDSYVKFLAYCVMPDHYHLLVKILEDGHFSKYISDVENSFTRYFNVKNERKGPLWQSSFRSVRVKTNEQLLHVHRYIHLNPTTNNLVERAEEWTLSSYKDFITDKIVLEKYVTEISIKSAESYEKFIEGQKDYQKKLKQIKRLLLD